MRVFVTGATGFVGSATVRDLLVHGHEVLGLVRSQKGEEQLERAGAKALSGDLEMPGALRAGVAETDAVIHAGFVHDFTRFGEACAIDRAAIETIGEAVGTSGKPLVVTAGVAFLDTAGDIANENDHAFAPSDQYPRASEAAAAALIEAGIPTAIMRLPPSVHGAGDHGFVPMLIDIARRTGVSAFIGEGDNLWPAVHVADAAGAYRLAVEKGPSAATYHAVAEEGVPFSAIAQAISTGLGVPCVSMDETTAKAHFGWFYGFAAIGQRTSSGRTQQLLGWHAVGETLLQDIARAGYF
ncbi:NAD-dependent epimerase/dehydratase [Devosia sp. LC5]|uniref:SDR family oxidoreductase n=1 Tax=Devosia sp. LC5 TaxID=1502724 RepID=UPI0004E33508|nr:SDR family oxidoreductase [Devosia sp. LC5]KFC68243.1 NAD-dependent epimerase/dehydratase [Devosia sp. LC5]